MLRVLTAGESHGPELVAFMEGLPSGVPISRAAIQADLARRKLGYGRGSRMKFEEDELTISSGVRHGLSLGSPIALRIGNTEWHRWVDVMSATPVDPETFPKGRGAPLTRPRPGHADLVGMQKYDFPEARNVLERASARETAARVALGAIARSFLSELGIGIVSHVLSIGTVRVPDGSALPSVGDVDTLDADLLRCFDPATSALMVAEVDRAPPRLRGARRARHRARRHHAALRPGGRHRGRHEHGNAPARACGHEAHLHGPARAAHRRCGHGFRR